MLPQVEQTSLHPRLPHGLRELAPLGKRRRVPWWVWPLAAAMLLAGAGAWSALDQPSDISDVRLAGARSPVPQDVMVLLDESGSFEPYARVREATVERLIAWAPKNLRPDDTVTVISFAGGAAVRLTPTPVAELDRASFDRNAQFEADGTEIQPALSLAGEARSKRPRALIVVTDTQISDADRVVIGRLIMKLNATTLSTVLPKGETVNPDWARAFAWEEVFRADPDSADQVSLALGNALAHATGQRLERDRG